MTLTQFPNQKKYSHNGVDVIPTTWIDFYQIVKKLNIHVNISNEFESYLIRSHGMKINDIDIWAVSVKDTERKRLEIDLIYRNKNYHLPVFIGQREWDAKLQKVIVNKLYPVVEVLEPDHPRSRLHNNGDGIDYIYVLNQPIILAKPIKKKFSQNSAIAVSFDEVNKEI